MAKATTLTVTSEDEAWAVLESAIKGELPENVLRSVDFDEWPRLDIYLPHTPIDSSLSPSMMEAMIDLQKSIYRSHAAVTTGDKSTRLSKADRERLEFRVKVEGGSSKLSIDLTEIAHSWGIAALGRLTPEQTMIAILATVLAIAGVSGLALFLKYKTDVRKAELDVKGQQQFFDAFKNLTEQDTARQALWAKAAQQVPLLRDVKEESDRAKDELLKALADEGGGDVNGLYITEDVARDLTAYTRRKPEVQIVRKSFRVDKVDTTTPNGFRVTLSRKAGKEKITAGLLDAMISQTHRDRIQKAEWSKKPVEVELHLRKSRGRIVDATIVDVAEPQT